MQILLVTGSTRARSTNTASLRTIASLDPATRLVDAIRELPPFDPDDDGERLPPAPAALRAAIAGADAVLFCTPEYAGTLPGSFKNLLDWTVGGGELDAKACAWLTVGAIGRGSGAVATLRLVLNYVGAAIVEDACVAVEVRRDMVGDDGLVRDPGVRAELLRAVAMLVNGAEDLRSL